MSSNKISTWTNKYSKWNADRFADCTVCDLGSADMIFVSGMTAMEADGSTSGEVKYPGDVDAQTRYIYDRIVSILEGNRASLKDVVRTVVFITDMRTKEIYEQIQREYYDGINMPVHTLVEVNCLAFPGLTLEIQVTAIRRH